MYVKAYYKPKLTWQKSHHFDDMAATEEHCQLLEPCQNLLLEQKLVCDSPPIYQTLLPVRLIFMQEIYRPS